ncbi:hypothetical protein ACFFNY_28660 [Paenibacillus hodogayensis]|uniref:Uncharacterized protein n=1 Tax=Paenibacillus hodogayensis TaxID=279208 RepID=A0ABV5W4R7_9BACL
MGKIVAIVSSRPETVEGGAPMFFVETEQERQELSFLLEKILDASAHDLKNGTMVLVDHKE